MAKKGYVAYVSNVNQLKTRHIYGYSYLELEVANMFEDAIAIVGMDCFLPSAPSVPALWKNIVGKHSGILRLEGAGDNGMHIAVGYLDYLDRFDYKKYRMGKREAELIDPQHRLFLNCTARALERYQGKTFTESDFNRGIGVFASCPMNTYLLHSKNKIDVSLHTVEGLQSTLQNDKDYIGLRTAHTLNLHGPAIDLQTSCSSSATAIHYACLSLLARDCDIAVAGGATTMVPQLRAYPFVEGSIFSSDGHCRPFSANATGTVHGNGAAVIILKRLDDAIEEHDQIFGVIISSAINNNGNRQDGFTAPSVEGWCEVIEKALGDIDVETIGIIETHGTATKLGDRVEIEAINRVFSSKSDKKGFCNVGTAKSHIGHQEAACGVINVIKACCSLSEEIITSDIYDSTPIDLSGTPFYFALEQKPWKRREGSPRRVSVNSSGMGGTNVHIIIEEAPQGCVKSIMDLEDVSYNDVTMPYCWVLPKLVPDFKDLGLKIKGIKDEVVFECSININSFSWLRDHVLSGTAIMPGTYFVYLLNLAAKANDTNMQWQLENVEFKEMLTIGHDKVTLRISCRKDGKHWVLQIESRGSDSWSAKIHANAYAVEASDNFKTKLEVAQLLREDQKPLYTSDIYNHQAKEGLYHGIHFQKMRHAVKVPQGILGVVADFEGHLRNQADRAVCLLDSCLQIFRFVHGQTESNASSGYLLTSFEKINIGAISWKEKQSVWCLGNHREKTAGNQFITDFTFFSEDGNVIGEIIGAQEKGVGTSKKNVSKHAVQPASEKIKKEDSADESFREVSSLLRQLVADSLGDDVTEISMDDTLRVLGVDSFSTLEISLDIQAKLNSQQSFVEDVKPEFTIREICEKIVYRLGRGDDDPFPAECRHG